ncbi:MAG: ROK family protein [Pyrinomonadaceae bacterium]|nr:ROK family protein [Pyrinomonadaceae bacterium]
MSAEFDQSRSETKGFSVITTVTERAVVIAVDLGGTHLRGAAVDETAAIHHRFKLATPRDADSSALVRAIVSAVSECRRLVALDLADVRAVAVVVPGNVQDGSVGRAPNISGLNGLPLRELLAAKLHLPVTIENDANAAAVGEMWQGAGRGSRTIVCLTLGTGVGGGIILDGKLWRGHDGSAAEVGHLSVNPFGGVKCPCGSHGCLEVYASATAIVRLTRERLPAYPQSSLAAAADLTAETIYRAGIAGDGLALEVFRVMGIYLGAGLASLINIINPEIIIIGGGAAAAWELFAETMHAEVRNRSFPEPAAQVNIVHAECGDDAGLLGAAHLAWWATQQNR